MSLKLEPDQQMLQETKTFLSKVRSGFQVVTNGGIAAAFFGIFQGRCTFAAIAFSIVGIYGWLHGRDLTAYVGLVAAIQSLLVIHSAKEDWRDRGKS